MNLQDQSLERVAETLGNETVDWSAVRSSHDGLGDTLSALRAIESIARDFRSADDTHHESPLTPGCRFDRRTLRKRVGRGAQGEVWNAYHAGLGCNVALKVCAGEASSRLMREARALARSVHPNILRVHGMAVEGAR